MSTPLFCAPLPSNTKATFAQLLTGNPGGLKGLRRPSFNFNILLIVAATVVLVSFRAAAEQPDRHVCYQALISLDLPIVTSGAVVDGDLLLAEAYYEPIIRLDRRAHKKSPNLSLPPSLLEKKWGEASPVWEPYQIHKGEHEYFILFRQTRNLEDHTQPWFRIFRYDEDLQNPEDIDIDYTEMLISDFEPMSGKGVMIYGKFREAMHNDSGFLYSDFSSKKDTVVHQISAFGGRTSPIEHTLYAYLNLRFMASMGTQFFMLRYERSGAYISVFDVDTARYSTIDIPEEFRNTHFPSDEQFVRMGNRHQATIFHKIMENHAFAMGIYAHNNQLFILVKGPMGMDGTAEWWLLPATGENRDHRIRLPVSGAHLTIIEDDANSWHLIERSRVQSVGTLREPYTRAISLITVPIDWLKLDKSSAPTKSSRLCKLLP